MNTDKRSHFLGIKQLTLRSVLIGMLGSIIITASSMYVALKMSALPWPTIFVAVLSMALLKILGRTNINEINIAQTGMSAGAMVAGGLAFTLPGLWISGVYQPYDAATESISEWMLPKFWPILLIAVAGMILGSLLCWYLRPRFIDQEKLPYPIGTAAAETLEAGDQGGHQGALIFITLGVAAIFTFLRDKLLIIPQMINTLFLNVGVGLYLSPMAVGIGYIIGIGFTRWWFAGAILSHFLIQQLGVVSGAFTDAAAAAAFNTTAAIGLMVGSGAGILLNFIYTLIQKHKQEKSKEPSASAAGTRRIRAGLIVLLAVSIAFVITVLAGLSPLVSLFILLGVLLATGMSATITGQTGINPMEIFAIIVLLAIRVFVQVDTAHAFLIAAIVAVACGYAGDLLNDYKAGSILKTNANAQLVSQIFGGLIGTVVASLALFAVVYQYGGQFGQGTDLPAAQALSVSAMVSGIGDSFVFLMAAIIGCLLYLRKVPAMIIGIGMLLSFHMAAAILLGGLIRLIIGLIRNKDTKAENTGNIIAAGLLGGEGITGVVIAILTMFSGR
ncbi:MAG: OPT/YSL family transporter [Eubacteriales bacterium]|nr:OPT/YSL family transporter [Eubacteriales bacterium]